MSDENKVELLMSNISQEPVDLLHHVVSFPDTVWANPHKPARSYVDQLHNYSKYKNFLSNMLYLKVEPYVTEYSKLLDRAKQDRKLVFECTCYPGPCHMDAIRERLTRDLESEGFTIVTNQGPIVVRNRGDEDDN